MSKRKSALTSSTNVLEFDRITLNERARREGPTKRKTWSKQDIRFSFELTHPQREMIMSFSHGNNILASGSAGTGKTITALYLALSEVLSKQSDIKRIIIVRSAVPTREIGFTPGTLEEKAALYELPYQSIFAELIGRESTYSDMKESKLVEFQTTSFVRGVTWDDAVVVVDEAQSMTFHELNSIMTRVGKNTRLIVCGDLIQTDFVKKHEVSGMERMIRIVNKMSEFELITFTRDDIVRSAFVKQWITACEDVPV